MSNSINNNDLFTLLDLPHDDSIIVSDISESDGIKYVHISRSPTPHFCPYDHHKMYSKGIYKREIIHPILQDTTNIHIIVHQRKWKCPHCKKCINESFPFLEPYKQSTNVTPLLVLHAMKDINRTTASVAEQFHISDTHAHDIFSAYVDLPRLSLPEIISIDEVYINISEAEKYAFVIMDFVSGEIVDILHNRWKSTLIDYFLHIPLEERLHVKYIVSDAYSPYMEFPEEYFPNAVSILDSFHTTKYLLDLLTNHINAIYRRYKEKNKEEHKKMRFDQCLDTQPIKDSIEMILLREYRWVLLKNQDRIDYTYKLHWHPRLGQLVNTYRIEDMFFKTDDSLRTMRDLKEEFIEFNHQKFPEEKSASMALDALIKKYRASGLKPFITFSDFLKRYKDPIVRSFTTVQVSRKTINEDEAYYSRLSNGPMESFNRQPKDYKRNTRGFSNFDYTRNRILWATRKNPSILGIPKTNEQIHTYSLNEKTLKKRRKNKQK